MTAKDFSKLLDKKLGGIATDLSAIEARIAGIEESAVTKLDLIEVKSGLGKLEKRLAAIEGKLAKTVTKKDLAAVEKRMRKNMITKGQLSSMEKRIIAKFNVVSDYFDRRDLEIRERVKRIEQHFGFATA